MQDLDATILQNLQDMLDTINPYIQNFRQARDIIQTSETSDISMVIHGDRTKDLHRYNAPTSSDVAVLMIGDGCDIEPSNRDILLKHVKEVYKEYLNCTLLMILCIMYYYFQEVMMVGMQIYLLWDLE